MKRLTLKSADRFQTAHIRKKRWHKVVTFLSCIVVFCTTYALILPAITMTDETYCGMEEHIHTQACFASENSDATVTEPHVHTEDCYETRSVLVCGQEETEPHEHSDECYVDGELVCPLSEGEGHLHSDECYEMQQVLVCPLEESETPEQAGSAPNQPTCGKEVHQHSLQCYSNPAAVETPAAWEAGLPELTGSWSQDLAAVARSQLGYTESESNFWVNANNTMKGYTRYGAWYGGGSGSEFDYADWDAMFVSFCLHYAGIPSGDTDVFVPQDSNCLNWTEQLRTVGLYQDGSYSPIVGDLVFFDNDQDGLADHIGIVVARVCGEDGFVQSFSAIEGDVNDEVVQNTYNINDSLILGYCALPTNQQLPVDEAVDGEEDVVETDPIYVPMDSAGEKITVDTCNVTLSLNLTWPNGKNPELTVYLINQSTGERVQTVTIAQNSTSKEVSITGLPRVDADGNEIQYSVELEKVSGYVGGYTLDTSDTTNTWGENDTLWVKASSIEAGKSYLLLTSDAVGPGNSQFIRANSTIVPTEMLSEDVALSAGPITVANGTSYSPYLKADADGISGALWTAAKNSDGFNFSSNYLSENDMSGYYLKTTSSLDKKGTKWKFDSKSQTISASKETLYPFEKVNPVYGTVRTVNMNVAISYTSIGQAEENWQEYTTIRVVKQWQDANGNPITAGLPESLKVTLTADGVPFSLEGAEASLTADNNWTYEWSVPRYSFDSGLKHEIQYSVQEETVDGFTQSATRSEDVYGDPITAWVLTDDFEDDTEFILTTSPLTGTVGALTATSSGAHWADGQQSTVNVKSGSLLVNGVTYNQFILDPGEDVIWKTGKGEEKKANQLGTHKMWTLYNEAVGKYLKNNGQGDMVGKVEEACWFYFNWYTGTPGNRKPSNPSSEWSNVLGSWNDYFLLSNNHTGDGGSTTAQTFWLYKKVEAQPVVHQITLVNSQQEAGYELPETGGAGTHLYTIGGLLLTAGSLLYLGCMKYRRERRFSA